MKYHAVTKCFPMSAVLTTMVFTVLFTGIITFATANYNGEPMALSQPDGSEVTVHLFGTPFFATAESGDGYTLIRDENGWICYAELSPDGAEYVSTGVRYTNTSRSPVARKGLRVSDKSIMEKRAKNVRALGDGEEEANRRFRDKADRHERRWTAKEEDGNPSAPAEDDFQHAPRDVVGLALFISFPDYPGPTGTVNDRWLLHADSVYNNPAYTRGSNAGYGSVYNYFQDISGGQVSYTNYVSVFVQAPQPFNYYDGVDNYGRVSELITAALQVLNQNTAVANQIANRVSRHPGTFGGKSRPAYALNIHPIRSGQRWSHGIWSHRGWYRGTQTVGGVPFYDYQFSGLGNAGNITNSSTLSTGVIIHENGHMLFDWPDLYNYNSGRAFVSTYCAMASGTVMPNPFFRDLEGWITVTDVTTAPNLYTHQANSNTAFVFRRTDVTGTNANRERYYIESRFSNQRSTGIPGAGLIVWHVHTVGDNANYDPNSNTANRRTPRVAIVQANNGTGAPNASATFNNASGRNLFNRLPGDNSTVQRRWHSNSGATGELWNGPVSDLLISEISASPTTATPRMTFRIGAGGSIANRTLTINRLPGNTAGSVTVNGTTYTAPTTHVNGTQVTLVATPASGFTFVNWTGTGAPTGTAANNTTATITMSANRTITANFQQAAATTYALTVIGGTGGGSYASGTSVTIAANSAATGNRFVRWSSSRLTPADMRATSTTVTTAARADTVTAHFGRVFTLPATIQADTFAFASNLARATSSNATGGALRLTGTGTNRFTEYAVNVTAATAGAGQYRIAYRGGSSAGARAFLRNVTTNTVIDTIRIPATGANNTYQTVQGRAITLTSGAAVWSVVADTGTANLDWISVTLIPPTYALRVVNGTVGAGDYESSTVVTITAAATNTANEGFIRWTSNNLTPADAFATTTTVIMGTRNDTVTARYGRIFALPGTVQADSFGFASNLARQSSTNAANGQALRLTGTGANRFAEYAVNHSTAANREFTYRVGSTAGGRFFLHDVTNNVRLDTIIVPATGGNNTYQTVTGRTRQIPAGRAVWRVIADTGTFNIDRFTANTPAPTSIKIAAGIIPMAYGIQASPTGNINFQVPTAGNVNIRMYDVRGRQVAVLSSGVKAPGYYNINIANNRSIPQGVYFVKMYSENYSQNIRVNYRK